MYWEEFRSKPQLIFLILDEPLAIGAEVQAVSLPLYGSFCQVKMRRDCETSVLLTLVSIAKWSE